MKSGEFERLDQEIVNTVEKNFSMLMSRLTKQQRKELEALFS